MKITKIAGGGGGGGGCQGDNCPTVYRTDRGTGLVQGNVVTDREALNAIGLPEGESIVEVPLSLLRDAAGDVG